ncbi:uncharacterized protein BCR38DRAFT_170905 [Pseudomassariella vexata]|uniref:Transcription factor domain-containing protein n=1 Tax=Pseudomassariella vexata TaxID=1141098 RepID=A0A1Y2E3B5_9PEZI|nr:uncharacterized protein BCR38DRAFT_170905 [Pseudomassariella vexata]ORY65999.1 hypothetical protein BCR38DRAFT_170905 [Pseudomassariella vexata]
MATTWFLGLVLRQSLTWPPSYRSTEFMVQDLEMMHSGLQKVMRSLNLPPIGRLHSSRQMLNTPTSEEPTGLHQDDEIGPSCDNSPKISPEDDQDLPKVPIHSVYHLTKLSALRSPDSSEGEHAAPKRLSNSVDDFISKGMLSLEDAERLFRLYMDHLDHFMYGIGGRHKTLDALRRSSRILSVCIFTVAALHDPRSNAIYSVCSKEFRRLMAASVFSRSIDRDYLRALCIASYWLSDISWIVSGYAIRRAAEFNLTSHYRRAITEGNEEAADYVRLWYILFVCDQHLSILYQRNPTIRDDFVVQGWESFIQSPVTNDEDKRLVSQVALLNIVHKIRELFGPDTGEPVPQVYLGQIASFASQLDRWLGTWSTALKEHHNQIGSFPRKGVLLHYQFALLYLYSHVFRGLRKTSIPAYFLDSAASAVNAATAIVSMLTADADIHSALAGMPSYLNSMTAFSCMFLVKLAMIHTELVDRSMVIDLTIRLIDLYRSTAVGKWHLVHLMADGLEKVILTLRKSNIPSAQHFGHDAMPAMGIEPHDNFGDFGESMFPEDSSLVFDSNFLMDYNVTLGASQLMYMSNGPTAFETSDLSPSLL